MNRIGKRIEFKNSCWSYCSAIRAWVLGKYSMRSNQVRMCVIPSRMTLCHHKHLPRRGWLDGRSNLLLQALSLPRLQEDNSRDCAVWFLGATIPRRNFYVATFDCCRAVLCILNHPGRMASYTCESSPIKILYKRRILSASRGFIFCE